MRKLEALFLLFSLLLVGVVVLLVDRMGREGGADRVAVQVKDETFQVTAISGSGSVFLDSKGSKPLDIRMQEYPDESLIRADQETAFEFFYRGVLFVARPGSQIQYRPKIRELCLKRGEFFWEKKIKDTLIEVDWLYSGNTLGILGSGRARLNPDSVEIWSYSAKMAIRYNNQAYGLNPQQYVRFRGKENPQVWGILPRPELVSSQEKVVVLNKPADSILPLTWKEIPGVEAYQVQVYSSFLGERVLLSKSVAANTINLDLMSLGERFEFFWDVYPVDTLRVLEGQPTAMGKVVILWGSVMLKDFRLQPPKLVIHSLSVSGNMVLIKGEVDYDSQLWINDQLVKMDMDGKFVSTISFGSIGPKEILFKAVSPAGLETVLKKQIIIFEE